MDPVEPVWVQGSKRPVDRKVAASQSVEDSGTGAPDSECAAALGPRKDLARRTLAGMEPWGVQVWAGRTGIPGSTASPASPAGHAVCASGP